MPLSFEAKKLFTALTKPPAESLDHGPFLPSHLVFLQTSVLGIALTPPIPNFPDSASVVVALAPQESNGNFHPYQQVTMQPGQEPFVQMGALVGNEPNLTFALVGYPHGQKQPQVMSESFLTPQSTTTLLENDMPRVENLPPRLEPFAVATLLLTQHPFIQEHLRDIPPDFAPMPTGNDEALAQFILNLATSA